MVDDLRLKGLRTLTQSNQTHEKQWWKIKTQEHTQNFGVLDQR